MRIAVLSDIHGNFEALSAVCDDLETAGADRVICLGDLVGYGPDPEAVVTRVRELGFEAVLGNHEAALASKRARRRMNFQAEENNISTESLLSEENLNYCCRLPNTITLEKALFVHGCPPDSVNGYLYMLPDKKIVKTFNQNSTQLFFVGHTHELVLVFLEDGRVVRQQLSTGIIELLPDHKYLINCGSVGQPRDGNNRAKYLIWDNDLGSLDVRAVSYNYKLTAQKILDRGFPESFAKRLH